MTTKTIAEATIEEAKVSDLVPEEKPHLNLSDNPETVESVLKHDIDFELEHDNTSILREDRVGLIWYSNVKDEVWVSHHSIPHVSHRVFRIK